MGHYDVHGGFRIDGVTGPDEYSAIADNNIYTNLMAQRNLRFAADVAERNLESCGELDIKKEELTAWRDAAEAMVIPYDHTLGVHSQAEGFTAHQMWDFAGTTPEQYPLLLNFTYFDLYRKQVVKQADLVLAMFTRGDYFPRTRSELRLLRAHHGAGLLLVGVHSSGDGGRSGVPSLSPTTTWPRRL